MSSETRKKIEAFLTVRGLYNIKGSMWALPNGEAILDFLATEVIYKYPTEELLNIDVEHIKYKDIDLDDLFKKLNRSIKHYG